MSELSQIIASIVVGQLVSTAIAVIILKVDNKWVKRWVTDHENRIRRIESGKSRPVDFSNDSGEFLGL